MAKQKIHKLQTETPHKPYRVRYHIGFLVHDVSRIRRTLFDKVLKPLGITRAQWWLLVSLSRYEGRGVSQRQLATAMQIGQASVGTMLVILETAGYIVRRRDLIDTRQQLICITAEGYQLLEKTREIARVVNESILKGVSADDLAAAERALRTMLSNLLELM